MALLFELIKKLTNEEKEQLKLISLQEREKAVLDFMFVCKSALFPAQQLCKQLEINSTHLDKIKSLLLKKVVVALSSNSIYEQIAYINSKSGLWILSAHLLKKHDQKLTAEQISNIDLLSFYTYCFEWVITLPFSNQLPDDVTYYGNKILAHSLEENRNIAKIGIEIALLRRDVAIGASESLASNASKKVELEKRLHILLDDARGTHSANIIYKAKLTAIYYYNFIYEYEKSYPYINAIDALLKKEPSLFTLEEHLIAKWHYAQILYFSSRFDESYEVYFSFYNDVPINVSAKWFSLRAEYMQVCLITGHLEEASKIYLYFNTHYTEMTNGNFYMSSNLQKIKFLLYIQSYEEVSLKLELLKNLITKSQPLQFQFVYRELTVAYLYLTKKYSLAIENAEKNLKFMRFKQIHKTAPRYTYHSRLAKTICLNKPNKSKLNKKEISMFAEMQKGTLKQFGILLMILMEM